MTNQDTIILEGEKAIKLWQAGQDRWNEWVEHNPIADVSFKGVDFNKAIVSKRVDYISFAGYNFPKGRVDFSGAKFGAGRVDFSEASFGEGVVNFSGASFGEGDVDFSWASFGEGRVDFSEASFGEGRSDFSKAIFVEGTVDFSEARFGEGTVDFSETNFGEGTVDFRGANFGKGDVFFISAIFGEGTVDFSRANFGAGGVYFSGANFGAGNVYFNGASFGEGKVNFTRAKFGEGDVDFSKASFGEGLVIFSGASFEGGVVNFSEARFGEYVFFENILFKGHADFSDLQDCDAVKLFSFKNVSFEKTFTISGDFGCVVDLVGTKTSHHVDLSGLTCCLERQTFWKFFKRASDKNGATRLRRLKELAENNKHHEAGLRFHADEMRAKRWNETGYFASWLDMLFSIFSNYGQSIWRPVAGLVLFAFASPFLADILQKIWEFMGLPIDKELVKTAIRNILSFLPGSRSAEISISSLILQLVAFIFLFLIGLGLRNRFRI
jgi:uncharacterized protein YjbI with pentapeptide repeats